LLSAYLVRGLSRVAVGTAMTRPQEAPSIDDDSGDERREMSTEEESAIDGDEGVS
jgi:hypothetical protein